MRFFRRLIFLVLLFTTLGNSTQVNITSMKAIYIERFTQFIEWPSDSSETFLIQIVGDYALYEVMKKQFTNHTIKNKPVTIIYSEELSIRALPHVLYIGNENLIPKGVTLLKQKPILTIAHSQNGCEKGVMINFVIFENRLRFEVNETSIRESSFYINYRLMSLAIKIIHPVSKS